ncbi:3,4-dihydroxy-2-butanone-4-phosphate synthase [Burkholderiaceae bacterium DAT-1]|nr:3,4-dihydroxy-2-butanone-4-phosphate synthase [Burkholderiaceae bacterium DAT-1]
MQALHHSTFTHYFHTTTPTERINRALAAMRAGKAVVLLDDEDRENEADLIVAAELIDLPTMATLIRDCSGIVCLCLPGHAMDALGLPPVCAENGSRYGTAFTIPIEARHGVTTGVSAADRVTTTRAALTLNPDNIVSPGHLYPIRAADGGVFARRGHTEGSVDLAMLAGLQPAALLCELMHPDGSMMRGDAVIEYAHAHDLAVLTIEDIVRFRHSLTGAAA